MADTDLRAVLAGDASGVAAFFRGMNEPQRRALAPEALSLYKQAEKTYIENAVKGNGGFGVLVGPAQLAVLATASLGELLKLQRRIWDDEQGVQVLQERAPPWLDEWAEKALDARLFSWGFVKQLVDRGLCKPPKCDNWVLGFIAGNSGGLRRFEKLPLRESVARNPELQEMLWRFFEVEGTQEVSLAQHDKYSREPHIWSSTLVAMAAEGSLSRSRLLDASLSALQRDFAQFRAGWFSALHEKLQPTQPERVDRRDVYLQLLASRIPPTVAFAVEALSTLDRGGQLDGQALINRIEPGVVAKSKKTALASIKLIASAVKRTPALARDASRVVVLGLTSEASDVQAAALSLLDKIASPSDHDIVSAIGGSAELVAPSIRPRLARWLANQTTAEAAPFDTVEAVTRVDEVIAPIATRDEVIEVLSGVIERLEPIEDLERVLDGVSRFCGEREDDFELKTGPLLKRARKLLSAPRAGQAMAGENPRLDFCALAISWITRTEPLPVRGKVSIHQLMSHRVRDVAMRALRGEARALLAMPTYRSGAIDAAAIVQRAERGDADWLDAVQALLRVRPDPDVAASPAARRVPGEFGRAMRYALGAQAEPPFESISLWLAAHRARLPFEDTNFIQVDGPDGSRAARYELQLHLDRDYRYFTPQVDVIPPMSEEFVPAHLPVLLHCPTNAESAEQPAVQRARVLWSMTVWPSCLEPLFEASLSEGANGWGSSWGDPEAQAAPYLEALLHCQAPLGSASLFALTLALNARVTAIGTLAADVVGQVVADGRLTSDRLGASLGMLTGTGGASLGRLAQRLNDVAKRSPQHSATILGAIEAMLPAVAQNPSNDVSHVLSVMNELCAASSSPVHNADARTALEQLQGSGKRGKLAAQLLAR